METGLAAAIYHDMLRYDMAVDRSRARVEYDNIQRIVKIGLVVPD